MSDSVHTLMQLLKCNINSDFRPDAEICGEETVEEAFRLSVAHDVAQLAANGIMKCGLVRKDSDLWKRYEQQKSLAVFRTVCMEHEYENICRVLEERKIAYLPLKGAVIRKMYPESWMRTSCDLDILVHPEDLSAAQKAFKQVGYRTHGEVYHDISMFSPSGIHLELHFKITENMMPMDSVLRKVWNFATPVLETCSRYSLSPEFQLFHAIAHMAYHYYAGGCGIRPVLDLWILEKKLSCDATILNVLLEDAGLIKFYRGVQKLIRVWFEEEESDALSQTMEVYILRGGVYGNASNAVAVKRTCRQSKTGYLFSRIFPPYSMMKERDKILKKVPLLLPFCWFWRLLTLLVSPEKRKRTVSEFKINQSVTDEQIATHASMLKELGLLPEI